MSINRNELCFPNITDKGFVCMYDPKNTLRTGICRNTFAVIDAKSNNAGHNR